MVSFLTHPAWPQTACIIQVQYNPFPGAIARQSSLNSPPDEPLPKPRPDVRK